MQLVLPKQDDVRKYGFFFDSGQTLDFSSVSELRDLIRNSRCSIASQNGNSFGAHPVMGIAAYGTQARVYYSKLTMISEAPDFTSDDGIFRTLLVTGLKDGSGRKSSQMSMNDNFSGSTPFPGNTDTWWATPFCLIPTKIGQQAGPTANQVSFPDTQVTVSTAGRQTGDSYSHRRRVYTAAGMQEIRIYPHSWTYTFTGTNYSNWNSSVTGAMAFSMGAYTAQVSDGGYWRATVPARRNAYDSGRYTPCSQAYGSSTLAEGTITLDKFAVFINEGTRVRVVKYGPEDFTSRNTNVGNTFSVTLPELPVLYKTDSIKL
ncbi:hypothetical protein MPK64_gp092 [Erwinia phage pEa_SNUABM_16]|uniref:Uncharacterized protein n=1 Tax=Erwinia phage pEa_SNUABM_16 TaxID=2869544 RepID=A0AAE9BUJ7_9CAUD|nr:hypothetical protein MPK64_gp092 [Erwinia phage pEa_SNUABM_16]QZE58995.1 hypothetical protein pEaSNUABM18_00092 [Erwinia phage pEa_SNUABM_18]UAW96236.1 hypothetical protein pEaSNUABM16_00092 [Erwinia phage pEa_SNUABM_16]